MINKICELVDEYSLEFDLKLKHAKSAELISLVSDRPGHDKRYAIDPSKLFNDLKWESKVNFEDGLKKTIVWYLKNENWWKQLINK